MPVIPSVQFDHVSYVVPDLDAAVDFFTNYLGFELLSTAGPLEYQDDSMTRIYAVPVHSVGRFARLRMSGHTLEFVEWKNFGESMDPLRESTIAGCQIVLSVSDFDEVIQVLKTYPRMRFMEIHPDGFVYCFTPFGFQIKLMNSERAV